MNYSRKNKQVSQLLGVRPPMTDFCSLSLHLVIMLAPKKCKFSVIFSNNASYCIDYALGYKNNLVYMQYLFTVIVAEFF